MVAGRVRVDIAAAAAAWLAPWAAWLAGPGGVAGVVAMVVAAFWGTPLLAVPLALLACALQWGVAGTSAFFSGVAALVTGRALAPDLVGRIGTILAWLALAWRAAAAASRPVSRAGAETELRQGAVGWVALAIGSFWTPARLLGVTLLSLGAFLAAGLDALALSQLHEFERRFGAAAERRGYRSAAASSLWVVVGGGTLAAWILAGGGGILPRFFHLLDAALVFLLTPVFLGVGYLAQVVLELFTWLLHGKKLTLPKLNAASGVPKNAYHVKPAGPAPLWAVLAGRWLLVLGVVGVALVVLALLRARRHEVVAAAEFTEEREDLSPAAGAEEPPPRRWRGAASASDLAIRRIFRRWLDLAAHRGSGRRPAETAREHFRRALAPAGDLAARAEPLLSGYERGRYGSHARPEDVAAAEAALDKIRRDWRG